MVHEHNRQTDRPDYYAVKTRYTLPVYCSGVLQVNTTHIDVSIHCVLCHQETRE